MGTLNDYWRRSAKIRYQLVDDWIRIILACEDEAVTLMKRVICIQYKRETGRQTRQILLRKVRPAYSLTYQRPLSAYSNVTFVSPIWSGLVVCRKEVPLTKDELSRSQKVAKTYRVYNLALNSPSSGTWELQKHYWGWSSYLPWPGRQEANPCHK